MYLVVSGGEGCVHSNEMKLRLRGGGGGGGGGGGL